MLLSVTVIVKLDLRGGVGAVGDANRDRERARPVALTRRPGEDASGRVDGGPAGAATRLYVSVCAGRSASVAPPGTVEQRAFGHGLIADRGQDRRGVVLGDGDGEARLVGGLGAVGDANRDRERAGAVAFARRPGEHAGRRIERGASWRGNQAVGQRLGWQVGIRRGGGHGQQRAFGDGLIGDRREDRRAVALGDGDREADLRGGLGAVGDPNRDRERARSIALARRPREDPRRRIDRGPSGRGDEAIRQRLRRQIGIRRRRVDGEQRAFVHRLRRDRRQHRRGVAFRDRNREADLGCGAGAVRHPNRDGERARPVAFTRRPGEDTGGRIDARPRRAPRRGYTSASAPADRRRWRRLGR